MSLRADEQFLTAVAAALGETIALVRRRGFHLDVPSSDVDLRLASRAARRPASTGDDAVDLAAYGLDWDADDDCRTPRRRRVASRRSRRPAA